VRPTGGSSPGLKTPEESEKAFSTLRILVRFLKSFQRVQLSFGYRSCGEVFGRPARVRTVFSPQEVYAAIAGQVDSKVTFQAGDDFNLSASEVL